MSFYKYLFFLLHFSYNLIHDIYYLEPKTMSESHRSEIDFKSKLYPV